MKRELEYDRHVSRLGNWLLSNQSRADELRCICMYSAAVSVGFSLALPFDSRSIGDFLANPNAYRK